MGKAKFSALGVEKSKEVKKWHYDSHQNHPPIRSNGSEVVGNDVHGRDGTPRAWLPSIAPARLYHCVLFNLRDIS